MKAVSLTQEIGATSYPGRGIVLGRSADSQGGHRLFHHGQKRKQQKQSFC